jgi:hypothetical protein
MGSPTASRVTATLLIQRNVIRDDQAAHTLTVGVHLLQTSLSEGLERYVTWLRRG